MSAPDLDAVKAMLFEQSYSFLLASRTLIDGDRYGNTIYRDIRIEEFDERLAWLTDQGITFTLDRPLESLPHYGVFSISAGFNQPVLRWEMRNLWVKIPDPEAAMLFKLAWSTDILETVALSNGGVV